MGTGEPAGTARTPAGARVLGYARIGVGPDELGLQQSALRAAGCSEVRVDAKPVGALFKDREALKGLIAEAGKGDVLVTTRLDRLARNVTDLAAVAKALRGRGMGLRVLDDGIDSATPRGRAFLALLPVFASFEERVHKERQLEGIAKAKADGAYRGRPASIDAAKVRELLAQGMGAIEIARQLNIGRASVYRILNGKAG